MKTKRLTLILALVLVVSMSVSGFASTNPFADVPADHWAYDSIIELAAVGLVEGYPDGTYGGSRMLTRYEAAMVFARTLARLEALVASEVARSTAGVQKEITADVLADIEAAKASLTQLVKDELAKIELPVVEKTIVEQPIEKIVERQPIERPFELTAEAEEIIGGLVSELAQKHLADAEALAKETIVETTIIERVVQEMAEVDEDIIRAIVEELLAASLADVVASVDKVAADHGALASDYTTFKRLVELRFTGMNRAFEVLSTELEEKLGQNRHEVNALIDAVRGDVASLEAALEQKVADVAASVLALSDEFSAELKLLGVRVDKLEMLYASIDSRVSELETSVAGLDQDLAGLDQRVTGLDSAVAGLDSTVTGLDSTVTGLDQTVADVDARLTTNEATVANVDQRLTGLEVDYVDFKTETERVKFSGNLNANVSKADDGGASYVFGNPGGRVYQTNLANGISVNQEFKLNLAVKASETVTVNVFTDLKGNIVDGQDLDVNRYGIEVLSASPVSRVIGGKLRGGEIGNRFSSYVVNLRPEIGVLADVNLLGANTNALFGRRAGEDVLAVGGSYSFTPVFGVQAAYSLLLDDAESFVGTSAALVGVNGNVFGVDYAGVVAMDNEEETDNRLYEVKLNGDFGLVAVDATWAKAEDNFGEGVLAKRNFYDGDADTRLELGAKADVLGVAVDARLYNERNATTQVIDANMITVSQDLVLGVPLTISGAMGRMEQTQHSRFTLAVSDLNLFSPDLAVGSSYSLVNQWLTGNWRNPSSWEEVDRDVHVITADVGYGLEVNGANVDLGYDLRVLIPRGEFATDYGSQATHSLKATYGFADSVKLNVIAQRTSLVTKDTILPLDVSGFTTTTLNVQEVKAGLEFKF